MLLSFPPLAREASLPAGQTTGVPTERRTDGYSGKSPCRATFERQASKPGTVSRSLLSTKVARSRNKTSGNKHHGK